MKTELELFAIDGELAAEVLNGMGRKKVFVQILPDFFDQLEISFSHRIDKISRWAGFE